ncbi:MAG: TetR/AcrR family transcriptional regulator [Limnochordia bacterium]|jgi:AcrR family transcriptional regulator|nr:TetR/AcrR family transcriptional regulator [Limnochordia bacterium]MDD2629687.1 TetR/AcrR family transcriptional regulator [Limnochordia bacterium]MDD4518064.1 TetR/AcrR family transcriptional regulator [Limnochordia bacterium]
MTTKEKITYEALSLFSIYGYEAVTIRQIASAVGIKESSVYNHFHSKKDILDTIVEETSKRYEKTLEASKVPQIADPDVSSLYDNISDEDFLKLCTSMFLFYLKDEYISKLRRLLTIEQYGNAELGAIFKELFIDNVLNNQARVLQKFIDAGRFIEGDAYTMALHFYSPIFLLLCKYDNSPQDEALAIEKLKTHVTQYNELYRKDKNPAQPG